MSRINVTRGYGLFEGFLAEQRSKMANRLILSTYRKGRILDIGCGIYPFFLLNTKFSEKYGIDKVREEIYLKRFLEQKIIFINYDIEKNCMMPFDNNYFDVVTMLAVIEHLESERVVKILREVHRILKPFGMFIVTTPASWTDRLLRLMARLRLVSPDEIKEHKYAYNHKSLFSILKEANFSPEKLSFGYFELFMNIWTTATK
ncbi:MAG: class I SAM-dependent methyltransferase [Nitrospirae bacterium]|nr:class I SAM-dependent methyltransferase [Nitrospirota bacterium]